MVNKIAWRECVYAYTGNLLKVKVFFESVQNAKNVLIVESVLKNGHNAKNFCENILELKNRLESGDKKIDLWVYL